MFDPACFDLARHFLGDLASKQLCDRLAQEIQTRVESWLEHERNEIADKLGVLGPARGEA